MGSAEEVVDDLDVCVCGHDVECHNDIWKLSAACNVCEDCFEWKAKE